MSLHHPVSAFWDSDAPFGGPAGSGADQGAGAAAILGDLAGGSADRFVFDDAESPAVDVWSSLTGGAGGGFDIGDGTLFGGLADRVAAEAEADASAADSAAEADGTVAAGSAFEGSAFEGGVDVFGPAFDADSFTWSAPGDGPRPTVFDGGRFATPDSVAFGEVDGLLGGESDGAPFDGGFARMTGEPLVYVSNLGAPGADPYNIQVEFYGDLWTNDLLDAFVASADLISSLIGEGLPSGTYRGPYDEPYWRQDVRTSDDIVIEAYLTNIDGPGGVLGQAGPTYVRSSDGVTIDGLPLAGIMEFDEADAQNLLNDSLWDDTVFHEMMHVMGIGTYWDLGNEPWDSLVGDSVVLFDDKGTGTTSDDIYGYEYFGDANDYFDDYATIPVESDGGPGTAGGHWDEEALQNEIMTGFIDNTNYLGEISVAALYDLGYAPVQDWQTIIGAYANEIDLSSGETLIA